MLHLTLHNVLSNSKPPHMVRVSKYKELHILCKTKSAGATAQSQCVYCIKEKKRKKKKKSPRQNTFQSLSIFHLYPSMTLGFKVSYQNVSTLTPARPNDNLHILSAFAIDVGPTILSWSMSAKCLLSWLNDLIHIHQQMMNCEQLVLQFKYTVQAHRLFVTFSCLGDICRPVISE